MSWIDNELAYTGCPEWHSTYTIQLGELVASGVFDWSKPELDWSDAAYNRAQYDRVCAYFLERFKFYEISIVPFYEWANFLKRKLVYELMPKYRLAYAKVDDDFNPFALEDEYYKGRKIESDYPQTLLSSNSDYATIGNDEEWERIRSGNDVDMLDNYFTKFKAIDKMLLDELETLFICVYSTHVNGW